MRRWGPIVVAIITYRHAIEGKEATDRGECEAYARPRAEHGDRF